MLQACGGLQRGVHQTVPEESLRKEDPFLQIQERVAGMHARGCLQPTASSCCMTLPCVGFPVAEESSILRRFHALQSGILCTSTVLLYDSPLYGLSVFLPCLGFLFPCVGFPVAEEFSSGTRRG